MQSSKASEQETRALASALLTRDFIAKSLYNQDTGYFSTKDVINDLPGPLEFGSMLGELHYRLDVKKASWVRCLVLVERSQGWGRELELRESCPRFTASSPPFRLWMSTSFERPHDHTHEQTGGHDGGVMSAVTPTAVYLVPGTSISLCSKSKYTFTIIIQ